MKADCMHVLNLMCTCDYNFKATRRSVIIILQVLLHKCSTHIQCQELKNTLIKTTGRDI